MISEIQTCGEHHLGISTTCVAMKISIVFHRRNGGRRYIDSMWVTEEDMRLEGKYV